VAARQQVPTETDPVALYAALFRGQDTGGDPARAARRLRQRRSALDYAAADLATLAGRLGGVERAKLDAHTSALRELEQRLGQVLVAPAGVSCGLPAAARAPLDAQAEDNVPALLELMIDLVAQALACNLTRIVTFTFGHCGNQWSCRWMGFNVDWHEGIAHQDTGMNELAAQRMTAMAHWHAGHVARLARALAAAPDGDGSALDHSLIVSTSEIATGPHTLDNIPVTLIGGASGRLRRPGLVVDAGVQPNHRVATSVMRLMGVDAAGFGDRPECGPVPGLG